MSFKFKDIDDFKDCLKENYLDMIVHDKVSNSYFRIRKPKEDMKYLSLFRIGNSFQNEVIFLYNRYLKNTISFVTIEEMMLGNTNYRK